MVVFADIFFVENFLMNYVLLYSLNRFCNYKARQWRICISSAVGALFGFTVFFGVSSFAFFIVLKILASILMIFIAFFPKTIRKLVRTIILLYIETFILGGGIFALFYLLNFRFEMTAGAFIIEGLKAWHIIAGGVLANILIKLGFDFFENYYGAEKNMIYLNVELHNKHCSLKALIDTGNSLKDPITNTPIIIVQINSILNILPEEFRDLIEKSSSCNDNTLLHNLLLSDLKHRFRMIPYKTLGTDNGTLIGIRVDKIYVKAKRLNKVLRNPIIAIYNNAVSDLGEYDALAYPEILKGEFICTD